MLYKIVYHINAIIKKLFLRLIYFKHLSIGEGTTWRKGFTINIEKKGTIKIGKHCFFNNNCSLTALNLIEIDENTIFGEGVKVYDHNHIFYKKDIPLKKQGFSIGSVRIGKNCWIGSNCVLLKGTAIGDNCVIGAGCIINGKIEPNSIIKRNYQYNKQRINYTK